MDIGSHGGVRKKVYIFIEEFRIYVMHIVDDNKLQVNFEVIILWVGLDVFQNLEVVIIKKGGRIHPLQDTCPQN